jgi:two-component system chemotaxis response regulator CheB
MTQEKKNIRVLVVDDSIVAREMIRDILESAAGITVVAEASNGQEAVTKAKLFLPDLITLDVKMPIMDGLEAVRAIMSQRPTPILIITASLARDETDVSFQAISDGALDVMLKPIFEPGQPRDVFRDELIEKVRILSRVKVISHFGRKSRRTRSIPKGESRARERVVGIGASTGGPEAVMRLLASLPANFPSPVAIVQHISSGFDVGFASWLNRRLPFDVKVAASGDRLRSGRILVAPTNIHLSFHGHVVHLDDSPPVNSCRPAVDVLFQSLAASFKANTVGVILTGIGSDGTQGAQAIKNHGGATIAQDRESSVAFGMPHSAIVQGVIDEVLPLDQIPEAIVQAVMVRR